MTDKEKYEKYCEMRKLATGYKTAIRAKMENTGRTVYTLFISPVEEETETYFIDIEVGGSEKTYRHVKGNFTGTQIVKLFF